MAQSKAEAAAREHAKVGDPVEASRDYAQTSDHVKTELSAVLGALRAFQDRMNAGGLTSDEKAEFDRSLARLQVLVDGPKDEA
jgi:hypothetical protein